MFLAGLILLSLIRLRAGCNTAKSLVVPKPQGLSIPQVCTVDASPY